MYLNIHDATKQSVADKTTAGYKLYNLLFAGKISLTDYVKALKRLNNKHKEE